MTTTHTNVQLFSREPVNGTVAEAAVARAAQEVQAAMVIAKRFPRNETEAWNRIMQACKRKTLAECACYVYPRGGTTVTGPSIRLAEAIAQNWGNLDFGIVELDQRNGESQVMSYAWDLETNTRQTKIFTVKHERRRGKENVSLDDPRDIYEMVANQGARRLRACILGVVPGDVVDAAVNECETTMKNGAKEPLIDRVKKMVVAFAEHGVTAVMIEAKLGHKLEASSEQELANLRKIFTSLRDGMGKREDWFAPEPSRPKFDASDDEVPMTFPQSSPPPSSTAGAEPNQPEAVSTPSLAEQPPASTEPVNEKGHLNHVKAVTHLLQMGGFSELELIEFLHDSGKLPEGGPATIREMDKVAQETLKEVCDNFSWYGQELKRVRAQGGKK